MRPVFHDELESDSIPAIGLLHRHFFVVKMIPLT
jgi:hypothetical protein